MNLPSSHPRDEHVERYLLAVEVYMRAEIARTPAAWPARTLLDAGGKRLRARLLWWSACATATTPPLPENDDLVRAGAAIEFAHLASLIHDDIVDGGESRRGIATVHRQCGVRSATAAGASLAHISSSLVASLGNRSRRAVRRAILSTCRGQVRELAVAFVQISPRARLAIMQEKTGAFFELAAALGAIIGGADHRSEAAVRRFARRFGVAFQIADDVLDLAGDPLELGRANGSDLRDGVFTLPTLLAGDPDRTLARALGRLKSSPDQETIATCTAQIRSRGGISAATSVAKWWLQDAITALIPLAGHYGAAELTDLAEESIARGLRPGISVAPLPVTTPLVATDLGGFLKGAQAGIPPLSRLAPDRRLSRVLNWFYPGLDLLISQHSHNSTIVAHQLQHEQHLLQHRHWSPEARTAATAIAVGQAIAEDKRLESSAATVLILVDALHCASIALLCDLADSAEHEALSARARGLLPKAPLPDTWHLRSPGCTDPALGVQFPA